MSPCLPLASSLFFSRLLTRFLAFYLLSRCREYLVLFMPASHRIASHFVGHRGRGKAKFVFWGSGRMLHIGAGVGSLIFLRLSVGFGSGHGWMPGR